MINVCKKLIISLQQSIKLRPLISVTGSEIGKLMMKASHPWQDLGPGSDRKRMNSWWRSWRFCSSIGKLMRKDREVVESIRSLVGKIWNRRRRCISRYISITMLEKQIVKLVKSPNLEQKEPSIMDRHLLENKNPQRHSMPGRPQNRNPRHGLFHRRKCSKTVPKGDGIET